MRNQFPLRFAFFLGIANFFACESNAQNTWIQKSFFGGGVRSEATGFSIGSKGYIGTGWSNTALTKDFWAYDTLTNTWTQQADFGGSPRSRAVGFSIGTKGYIGTGLDTCSVCPARKKDFWEYNSITNTWVQKADFGGTERYLAVGFSIGGKGYIGTGNDGANENDFWEYDTTSNTWSQKAFLTGLERNGAFGFSIGNKGYIGGGGSFTDFYEYNPINDSWTQKANIIVYGANYACGFAIGTRGYVLTGNSGAGSNFSKYDPATNKWILVANLATSRDEAVGFSLGNFGYIGTGHDGGGRRKDFWKYTPCSSFLTATITPSGSTTLCSGQNVTLTANTGNSYVWWTNQTTQSIVVSASGTYAVMVTDSCGTATSSPISVTVNPGVNTSLNLVQDAQNPQLWYGYDTILSGTPPFTYSWDFGDGSTSTVAYPSHTYSVAGHYAICVTITDANGCNGTTCDSTYKISQTSLIKDFIAVDPLTTAVGSFENYSAVKIFPNPSDGVINVSAFPFEGIEINLFNLFGECLCNHKLASGNEQIDLSLLPAGVYFLKLTDRGGSSGIKKVVLK